MLFLGGGGSAQDERRLWLEAFVPGSTVVVLPFAHADPAVRRSVVAWMTAALADLGVVDVFGGADPDDLRTADVVAIPGGNTFLLVHTLRRLGFFDALADHPGGGGSLYGGSAGAVLAGADVDIAAVADPNDVGLADTTGLDLLGGADVLPHFTADQAEFARHRAAERNRRIICIPERAGVVVDRATARNVGPDDVQVISASEVRVYAAGESWRMSA